MAAGFSLLFKLWQAAISSIVNIAHRLRRVDIWVKLAHPFRSKVRLFPNHFQNQDLDLDATAPHTLGHTGAQTGVEISVTSLCSSDSGPACSSWIQEMGVNRSLVSWVESVLVQHERHSDREIPSLSLSEISEAYCLTRPWQH